MTKEGVNKFIEEDLKHFWSWKYAPNDNSFKSVIIYKTDIDDENSYDSVKQIKEQLVKEGVNKFIEEDEENYAKGGKIDNKDLEKLNAYWQSFYKGVMAGKKDEGYITITNKDELNKYITSKLGNVVKNIELIEKGKNYPYNDSYPYYEDIYSVELKNGTTFKIVRSYGRPRWQGNVDYKEQIIVENIKQYADGGNVEKPLTRFRVGESFRYKNNGSIIYTVTKVYNDGACEARDEEGDNYSFEFDELNELVKSENNYADGGFMSDVYADGGAMKKEMFVLVKPFSKGADDFYFSYAEKKPNGYVDFPFSGYEKSKPALFTREEAEKALDFKNRTERGIPAIILPFGKKAQVSDFINLKPKNNDNEYSPFSSNDDAEADISNYTDYYADGGFMNDVYAKGGGLPSQYYYGMGTPYKRLTEEEKEDLRFNNYNFKSAKQVWGAWTVEQQQHFLKDHIENNVKHQNYIKKEGDNLMFKAFRKYEDLPTIIKAELIEHIKKGQYAKGGMVVTSIKDIPNFKERLEQGKITYRGLGMGKLFDTFYDLAGTSGTRIKVDGKEYYITDKEFDTFSRGADGKMQIRFDAPARKGYADGGQVRTFDDIFGKTIIFKEEQVGKFTIGISSGFNNNRHVFIYEGEVGRYGARLPKDFTQSPQLSVEFANNFYSNLKRKVQYNQDLRPFELIKDVKFLFADGGFMNDVYAKGGDFDYQFYEVSASTKNGYDLYKINGIEEQDVFVDNYKSIKEANDAGQKLGLEKRPMWLRYGKGGKMSNFDKLSAKVAKNYEGKPVQGKYQEEYGKVYSKAEAKEVGDKVAGKVKAMQPAKKEMGGETKKGRGGSEMLKQANILAKKIRKDGESWNDAKKRAFAQLKK